MIFFDVFSMKSFVFLSECISLRQENDKNILYGENQLHKNAWIG